VSGLPIVESGAYVNRLWMLDADVGSQISEAVLESQKYDHRYCRQQGECIWPRCR